MTITVAHYDLGVTTFTCVLNLGHTGGHLQVDHSHALMVFLNIGRT